MAQINGKAVLCPGCPVTGNFVGEVTAESQKFDIYSTEGSIMNVYAAQVYLLDEELMSSNVVRAKSGYNREQAEQDVRNLKQGAAETICNRVERCVGHTAAFSSTTKYSIERRNCPALNEAVLNMLSQEG